MARHTQLTIVFLGLAICLVICSQISFAKRYRPDGQPEKHCLSNHDNWINSLAYLSSKLLTALKTENKDNLLVSPFSIQSALNMVLLGAKGKTKQELERAMGYSKYFESDITKAKMFYKTTMKCFRDLKDMDHGKDQSGKPYMSLAEFWTSGIVNERFKIKSSYLTSLMKNFNTTIDIINPGDEETFEPVIDKTNGWCKKAGLSDILESKDLSNPDLVMMLLSAVRIESHWFNKFEDIDSFKFKNHGSDSKEVKGLEAHEISAKYLEFDKNMKSKFNGGEEFYDKHMDTFKKLSKLNFRALEIPLVGGMSYTILEPINVESGEEVDHFFKNLLNEAGALKNVLKLLRNVDEMVGFESIKMPRFKISKELKLKETLQKIGVKQMFDSSKAKLDIVEGGEKVFVSKVKQNAMIDVDKNGIKASAITSVGMVLHSAQRYRENISIQSPFIFVLGYEGVPLFVGHLCHVD